MLLGNNDHILDDLNSKVQVIVPCWVQIIQYVIVITQEYSLLLIPRWRIRMQVSVRTETDIMSHCHSD